MATIMKTLAIAVGLVLGAGLAILTVFVLWVAVMGNLGLNPFQ